MKTLEYIYQDTQIHFLVNPMEKNVMINATEMAKLFDKRIDHFIRSDHAKAFIKVLELTPYGGSSEPLTLDEIIRTRNGVDTYFNRILALKFAAWLDPNFELWVFTKIDEIIFGNYKKHWDAHTEQEAARVKMEDLKMQLLSAATTELAMEYFEAERDFKVAKIHKSNAIRSQLKLFGK